jgi:hypothetical protein
METKKNIFFKLVTKLHVSLQLLWQHLTYRHMGCSAMSHRPSEILAEHKKELSIFLALNAVISFLRFKARE